MVSKVFGIVFSIVDLVPFKGYRTVMLAVGAVVCALLAKFGVVGPDVYDVYVKYAFPVAVVTAAVHK